MDQQNTLKIGLTEDELDKKRAKDLILWRKYATDFQGVLEEWVFQSNDSLIIAASSKGVCFAMALDFVTAFQVGQPQHRFFRREILLALHASKRRSGIPRKYLEIQAAYKAMANQFNQNQKLLFDQLKKAKGKDKKTIQAKLEQLLDYWIKQKYGPGMESFQEFDQYDKKIAPTDIFKRMKATVTKNGPSYFLVNMSIFDAGHAIAFGFRQDLSAPSFPAIYEFFDANLGYFVFPSEKKLIEFFDSKVWSSIYKPKGYYSFSIISFTAKKGKR